MSTGPSVFSYPPAFSATEAGSFQLGLWPWASPGAKPIADRDSQQARILNEPAGRVLMV
jgi:hypothetical protein